MANGVPGEFTHLPVGCISRIGQTVRGIRVQEPDGRDREQAAVQRYGIKKIEAGSAGGRIHFGPDTKIDPTRHIKLNQTRPGEYKFSGGDKFRYFRDLTEPAQHIEQIGRVVERLVG